MTDKEKAEAWASKLIEEWKEQNQDRWVEAYKDFIISGRFEIHIDSEGNIKENEEDTP